MRKLAALVCAVVIGFSGLVFAFQFNSNYYGVYEAPGSNNNTLIYILPKNSILILGIELPTPIMFMPQTTGYMAILAPDGTLGAFSQVNNNANNLPPNAVASSYKLFGGDFDGDRSPDFLLQGTGACYSYVLTSNASGNAQIYYSFGTTLNAANYPKILVGDIDQNGRSDIIATNTSGVTTTYMGSSYVIGFEVAGSGGSSSAGLNIEVGSTEGAFRVNESGAATYSIPIMAVPGTAGVTPQISLSYSSQSDNGLAGKGWSIGGMSSIARCRQTRQQDGAPKPITWTADDRFCLDGQRLIVVSGAYGANLSTYKTEIDSYARITAVGTTAGNPNYFKVERKDGSVSYFVPSLAAPATMPSSITPMAQRWRGRSVNLKTVSAMPSGLFTTMMQMVSALRRFVMPMALRLGWPAIMRRSISPTTPHGQMEFLRTSVATPLKPQRG